MQNKNYEYRKKFVYFSKLLGVAVFTEVKLYSSSRKKLHPRSSRTTPSNARQARGRTENQLIQATPRLLN